MGNWRDAILPLQSFPWIVSAQPLRFNPNPLALTRGSVIRGTFSYYAILVGRALASLILASLLAFIGDVTARVLSVFIGYPWSLFVHQNIEWTGIGLGAGLGAYLPWVNLRHLMSQKLIILSLVLLAGVAGAYLGEIYGPSVDSRYYWNRFAIAIAIPIGAAICAAALATVLGIIIELFPNPFSFRKK